MTGWSSKDTPKRSATKSEAVQAALDAGACVQCGQWGSCERGLGISEDGVVVLMRCYRCGYDGPIARD